MSIWMVRGHRGGYDDRPRSAQFDDDEYAGNGHDRAQDWIERFKGQYPNGYVVMYQKGHEEVEHVVRIDDRIDGIFSDHREAEVWAERARRRLEDAAMGDFSRAPRVQIESVHHPDRAPPAPPAPPRRTFWERLDDEDD